MCGTGIVCTIGSGGKTILLRADMDALPIQEDTGLPFACQNGTAHACGHDMHTAMLLAAAKMLSETQDELKGTVKLMFQPAEEALKGATAMMKAGVLENPKAVSYTHLRRSIWPEIDGTYLSNMRCSSRQALMVYTILTFLY